ncbi:MAG TPA: rubrerythrin family protein [bacterium]|nr:rubrerythrin family protein [bacterium]HQG46755.1 rubrerythrin family protein [bacterium]HQJ65653.1 rubrerythrin family protein [bacterium]
MKTEKNLQDAFAGESQANRTYLAFAKKADAEGYPMIAKLFRAAAEAETIHAHAHLRVLGRVKSTLENLQVAADGEAYEFKSIYPEFLKDAEAEGNKAAISSFTFAMKAERIHNELYLKAVEALKAGKDLSTAKIYLCPVCGNVEIGEDGDEKCEICGTSRDKFIVM